PPGPPEVGKARLGHLAPFANSVDGTRVDLQAEGGPLPVPITFLEDHPYNETFVTPVPLPAATYNLTILTADGMTTLYGPDEFTLNEGDSRTGFFIGDDANQPFGIIEYNRPSSPSEPPPDYDNFLYLPTTRAD
ncbi:MAG: hypothetical protein ACRDIB_09790, partial [Ardenticatenaceae bacterium]